MSLLEEIVKENETLRGEIASVQESLTDLTYRIEEVGWTLAGIDGSSWDLEDVKRVAKPLEDMVQSNALMTRSVGLRAAYVYGDGVNFYSVSRAKKFIDKQVNQDAFFNSQAQMQRIRTRAATGNVFYLKNKTTHQIIHVPLDQIEKVLLDTMDPSQMMYVKRVWSTDGKTNNQKAWYKVATNETTARPSASQLGDTTIDTKWVMYHRGYNKPVGSAFGVPDALAAMKWAEAYAEYLQNQAKLVRSYSRIAFQVSKQAPGTASQVSGQIASAQETNTFGATVVGDVKAVPATGSNVDFNNGRPMASMVAAAMGVGVDALLSGTLGATKSVSDMLDLATGSMMKMLQHDEKELTEMILRSMGAPKARVDFPTMDTDPMYRRVQSAAQAVAQGLLWREEARGIMLDWFDIEVRKAGLPEPDGFNTWSDPSSSSEPVNPTPSQGNSGAVGGVGAGNDARDNGEFDQ